MKFTKTISGKTVVSGLPFEILRNPTVYEIGILECVVIEPAEIAFLTCDCIEKQPFDDVWIPLLAIINSSSIGLTSTTTEYFRFCKSFDQIEFKLDSDCKLLIRFHIRKCNC